MFEDKTTPPTNIASDKLQSGHVESLRSSMNELMLRVRPCAFRVTRP